MDVIVSVIVPMFIIIFLGFFAEKKKLLGEESVPVMNRFIYYFPLPVFLFGSMASEPFSAIGNIKFLLGFTLGMLVTFSLSFFGFKFLNKDDELAKLSLKSLGSSLPNAGYIGIPLLIAIAGKKGILPASLATVLVFIMVALTIFLIEIDLHRRKGTLTILKNVSLSLCKNPLIVAATLGITYSALELPLPDIAVHFYHFFGSAAAPCALFAIGGNLAQHQLLSNPLELSVIAIFKLVIHPLVTFIILASLKLKPNWIIAGTLLAALPTGAVKYMIAQHYHVYEKESSSLILVSTVLSIVSLTFIILIFHSVWPKLIP